MPSASQKSTMAPLPGFKRLPDERALPNGLLVAAERAIGAFGCHIGVGRGTHALTKQEHFGLPARSAFGAQKARGHDARLVGHEHVARLEVFNNVTEDAVFKLARFAIHHEHLARIAHRRRLLGDAALRKVVTKSSVFILIPPF